MSEIERLAHEANRLVCEHAGVRLGTNEEVRAAIEALAAAKVAGASSAEPVGWKLVPVKLTEAMHGAVLYALGATAEGPDAIDTLWADLLAAAPARSAESSAEQIGRDARMRAAGMSALLGEVMAQNARRDLDDDLVDRIERAIADQEAATSSAAPAPSDPSAPEDSTFPASLIKYSDPISALSRIAKRLRSAGISSGVADEFAESIEFLIARRDDLSRAAHPSAQPVPAVTLPAGEPMSSEWQWMTHPDRNDGKPIPVHIFSDAGVRYYRPFDTDACKFAWDERDESWQVLAAPTPSDPQANNWRDAYEGAREDLLLWKRRAQKAEQALAADPSAQSVPARQPLTEEQLFQLVEKSYVPYSQPVQQENRFTGEPETVYVETTVFSELRFARLVERAHGIGTPPANVAD